MYTKKEKLSRQKKFDRVKPAMEYHIYQIFRKIPFVIRFLLGFLFLIFGSFALLTPVFGATPGIILGLLFLVKANQIPSVIKIRKGFQFLFTKFSFQKCIYKFKDFKKHFFSLFFSSKK
jgi:hypothetical protein